MSFRQAKLIGVDIQRDAVRMAEVTKINGQYQIIRLEAVNLPPEWVVDGRIRQWEKLADLLAETVQRLKWNKAAAVFLLPAQLVRLQRLRLPRGLSEAELPLRIQTEVMRDMPGMQEALAIDYAVVEGAALDIYVTVAREAYISHIEQCLVAAGLNLQAIDLDAYAIYRAVVSVYQQPAPLILHAGAENLQLMIADANGIVFAQQYDWVQADLLAAQLTQAITQAANTYHLAAAKTLLICGDTRRIPVIADELARHYIVEIIEVFSDYQQANLQHKNKWLAAYGGAMRECRQW